MFEVSVAAQQCIVDALKEVHGLSHSVVLCHTPSEVFADGKCCLGTHDLFDDFLGKDAVSLISIFCEHGYYQASSQEFKRSSVHC